MRGSLARCRLRYLDIGIIPAHAGLTEPEKNGENHDEDHPRACGAHYTEVNNSRLWLGSSPRMRGSPLLLFAVRPRPGIIPAHAGLTLTSASHRYRAGDHPRACGAHPDDGISL